MFLYRIVVALFSCLSCSKAYVYSTTIVDPEIRLGFYYPMFPQYLVPPSEFLPSHTGIQNLAAIKMAIDELNNKTDGIFDDILPETQIKFACRVNPTSFTDTAIEVIDLETVAFGGLGIEVAIGALTNNLSQSMSSFLQDMDILQIGYSPGSIMSHNDLYTNFMRTYPSDALDAMWVSEVLVNHYGYQRAAVFSATEDTDSSDSLVEFSENAATIGLNIAVTELFSVDTTDFTSVIEDALQYDPRIIVILAQPANTAAIVEQGYALGLVKEGVMVVGTSYSAPPNVVNYFTNASVSEVATMMKGFVVITPETNWTLSPLGQQFIERFQKIPNTISYNVNGTAICDNATDDDGSFYLYQQHLNYNASQPWMCAGLIHSAFDASNIYLITAYAYDALTAMFMGLHEMVYTEPFPGYHASVMKPVIIEKVAFEGITGNVSFSAGRTSFNTYGIGDRTSGFTYKAQSFNADSYASSGGKTPFLTFGHITESTYTITPCTPGVDFQCAAPIYNTANNQPPPDSPPPLRIGLTAAMQMAAFVLDGIAMGLTAMAMAFCAYFYKNHSIKSAQPMLLFWTLLGSIFCAARSIVSCSLVSTTVCNARFWLFHLTFYIIMGSIMAKMYRLHLIINAGGMQKVVVSETFALAVFLGGLAFFIVFLIIVDAVGKAFPTQEFTTNVTGQRTYKASCAFVHPEVEYVLFAIEFLMLFGAIGLAWATSNAPKKVNETSNNVRSK